MFWNPLKKYKILKIVEKRTKLNVQYYQQSSQSLESLKLRSISVSSCSFRPIIGLLDSLLYLAPSNPSYLRAPIFLFKSLSPGSQNSALTLCSLYGVSSSGSLYTVLAPQAPYMVVPFPGIYFLRHISGISYFRPISLYSHALDFLHSVSKLWIPGSMFINRIHGPLLQPFMVYIIDSPRGEFKHIFL